MSPTGPNMLAMSKPPRPLRDNGIFRLVPGGVSAGGTYELPDPATATQDEASVVLDAGGHAGTVRIFYERMHFRHGKSSHWAWCAYRAERVELQRLPPM